MPVNVLFVCLGNICRSPTAHAVFEQRVAAAGLAEHIYVDSCGTGDWHVGSPPDNRSQQAAGERGYRLAHLRARQLAGDDFSRFDYILAMDRQNLGDIQQRCPADFAGRLGLFLQYCDPQPVSLEVPDPYYGGERGFARVLDLVESAADGLLLELVEHHGLAS